MTTLLLVLMRKNWVLRLKKISFVIHLRALKLEYFLKALLKLKLLNLIYIFNIFKFHSKQK